MFREIVRMLMERYGDQSLPDMKKAMREDGWGDLLDAVEKDPHVKALYSQFIGMFPSEGSGDPEVGVLPPGHSLAPSVPVEPDGTFPFDARACLRGCTGRCCKDKNYLMIGITDIFRIVGSRAAPSLDIRSTADLFDRTPPLIDLFHCADYGILLPFLRFLPVNADLETRPEDAEGSVCPFLRPIEEVYAFHDTPVPPWASEKALGCILMKDKPTICRLSPLGECRGLETGRVTYEYTPPARDCPACETHIETEVSEHLLAMVSPRERRQQARFHEVLMAQHRTRIPPDFDRGRFSRVLKQMYNVDGFLSRHGLDTAHRPRTDEIIEIVLSASEGNFEDYEEFVEGLKNKARG